MINGKYSVGIQCMTYNHSKYIVDALNSFVQQTTNFPFIILLVDDASTDGNDVLVKNYVSTYFNVNDHFVSYRKETEYADILYAQHTINQNCYIAAIFLKYNHYQIGRKMDKLKYMSEWLGDCKYIALCEGDDYWTDSSKLQKQVTFMDENEDYSLCFHNANIVYEDTQRKSQLFTNINKSCDITFEQLTSSWIIPTASLLYRKCVMDNYPSWTSKIYSGDLTLSLIAYDKGKIRYLNENMSVYRVSYAGSSASAFVKKQNAGFLQEQHIRLYNYYDQYTSYRYHDSISVILTKLTKELDFQRKLSSSPLIAFLYHPKRFIVALKSKVLSLINC